MGSKPRPRRHRELDVVRKRPAMYVGDTDDETGLHRLLWELVANSVDEHLAGWCDEIDIALHADGAITVTDEGRGMPVAPTAGGVPFAQHVLTRLHTTPTADGHVPHVHVGLSGVGLAVVNALSEHLELTTCRDGGRWVARWRRGALVSPLRRVGDARETGTTVRFRPDPDIFPGQTMRIAPVRARLDELAALTGTLRFRLRDERPDAGVLHRPEGLAAFVVGDLRAGAWTGPVRAGPVSVSATRDGATVEAVLAWRYHRDTRVWSFVNAQRTHGGGSHERGLLDALTRAYARTHGLGRAAARRAATAGLEAALHIRPSSVPRFAGPMKDRVDDPDVARLVRQLLEAPLARELARLG